MCKMMISPVALFIFIKVLIFLVFKGVISVKNDPKLPISVCHAVSGAVDRISKIFGTQG